MKCFMHCYAKAMPKSQAYDLNQIRILEPRVLFPNRYDSLTRGNILAKARREVVSVLRQCRKSCQKCIRDETHCMQMNGFNHVKRPKSSDGCPTFGAQLFPSGRTASFEAGSGQTTIVSATSRNASI